MLGRLVDERQRHQRRKVDAVWGTLADRLRSLDGLFVNLECCLSTRGVESSEDAQPVGDVRNRVRGDGGDAGVGPLSYRSRADGKTAPRTAP